jgi:hypothetical protein
VDGHASGRRAPFFQLTDGGHDGLAIEPGLLSELIQRDSDGHAAAYALRVVADSGAKEEDNELNSAPDVLGIQ